MPNRKAANPCRERSVDLVFGTDNLFELPELLAEVAQGERIARTNRVAPRQKSEILSQRKFLYQKELT